MQVRASRYDAPQRLRAELPARGFTHRKPIRQLVAHVVQQKIGVRGDRSARTTQRGQVASVAPDLVERRLSAFGLRRRLIGLRRSQQQRKADQVEQLGLRELWVRDIVEVDGGLVGDHRLLRDDSAHTVPAIAAARGEP